LTEIYQKKNLLNSKGLSQEVMSGKYPDDLGSKFSRISLTACVFPENSEKEREIFR
jgi:hypothetical protein